MKKKLLVIIMIVFGIFIINNNYVQAEEKEYTRGETPVPAAWPKELTVDEDYTVKIESIQINVYKYDSTKPSTSDSLNEDIMAYLNNTPTRVITLNASDYTIEPEVKKDLLNGYNARFINLKLNLTKEKVETLLADEINSTTDDIAYLADVVVNYKVLNYPNRFTHTYNVNLVKDFMKYFLAAYSENNYIFDNNVDITNTISQSFNTITVSKENNNTEVLYITRLDDENNISDNIMNYLYLSENNLKMDSNEEDTDKSKTEMLMFHNVENIQYLIDNYNRIQTSTEKETKDEVKKSLITQQVKVPNTAKNQNLIWFMISVVSILSGILIIEYALKMNQFKEARNKNY